MIYAIVAFDSQQGIATDAGIPWSLPSDQRHFRSLTNGHAIVMGYTTYKEFAAPLRNRHNFVFCQIGTKLREGFMPVYNLTDFLTNSAQDVWVVGGAATYAAAFSFIQTIYATRIEKDFHCTKFFPDFSGQFRCIERNSAQHENGLQFAYEVWNR